MLVATDAAGEGLNLQRAHLMINYDLPWNPNRIEQRFGRIHRIGQAEPCHLWNLVAEDTREGDVYLRLLDKIEQMRKTYQGKVFDVIGEVFAERSLADLLMEAIRYGNLPETKAKLHAVIDDRVAHGIPELLASRRCTRNSCRSPTWSGSAGTWRRRGRAASSHITSRASSAARSPR